MRPLAQGMATYACMLGAGLEAPAIVSNLGPGILPFGSEPDTHVARRGVAPGIGQGFLNDAQYLLPRLGRDAVRESFLYGEFQLICSTGHAAVQVHQRAHGLAQGSAVISSSLSSKIASLILSTEPLSASALSSSDPTSGRGKPSYRCGTI